MEEVLGITSAAIAANIEPPGIDYILHQFEKGPLYLRPKSLFAVEGFRESINGTAAPSISSQDGLFLSRCETLASKHKRREVLDKLGVMLGFERFGWAKQAGFFDRFMYWFYKDFDRCPGYIDFLSSRKPFGQRIAERGHEAKQTCNPGTFLNGTHITLACGVPPINISKFKARMATQGGVDRSKVRVATTLTVREFGSTDPFGRDQRDKARETHWCLSDFDHLEMLDSGKWPACSDGAIGEFYIRPMVGFCRVDEAGEVCRVTFDFIGPSAEVAVIHEALYPIEPAMRIGWRSAEILRQLI